MSTALILIERPSDGVALLRFNRPERKNALDLEMRAAFADALAEVEHDPSIRILVLAGSGDDFCAGGDVAALCAQPMSAEDGRRRLQNITEMVLRLHHMDKPVVAAVEGHAAGAGFSIALGADLIYVSPRACFCAAFGKLGLVPDAGMTYALPRRVGPLRAKELVLTARTVDATEAVAIGLATSLVCDRDVVDAAVDAAAQLAQGSQLAQSLAKRALDAGVTADLALMLDREADAQGLCLASDYFDAAARRFLEKRPAAFTWRDPSAPPAPIGDLS